MILSQITLDLTRVFEALIMGIPSMIAAIVTLIITLRGQTQIKDTVRLEAGKTAEVAKEVKETLRIYNHAKELTAQATTIKLDQLVHTTDKIKTDVNGNMTSILQTNADTLLKVVDIAAKIPSTDISKPQVQEVKLTADSEIKIVEETQQRVNNQNNN